MNQIEVSTKKINKCRKKGKVVTFRSNGKDIAKEPEMVELKRMIRSGELDPDRTVEHIKKEGKPAP